MPLSAFFCAALFLNAADAPGEAKPPKVIIIGLDGASLNVIEPLAAAGLIPNLSALMKAGKVGDFRSIWPLRTPQVWTTIVTGKYPGQHGIWDHYSNTRYSPPKIRTEERRRLTTRDRRSKALWNILDAQGIPTLSVGWIASWPAEKLEHGVMAAPIVLLDKRQVSIKGTFWKDARGQVFPKKYEQRVLDQIVEGPSLGAQDLKAFADIPPDGHPILAMPYMPKYMRALRWSVARARSVEAITTDLLPVANPQLLMFYFQCSDSLLHRFWVFQKSKEAIVERLNTHGIDATHAEELRQRFGRVPTACYQDFDARIGRILEKARDDNTLVLVVSDHGFGDAPFPHPKKTEPYGGNHRDNGVIIASAPWIEGGGRVEGVSVLDITPTILHLLRQPVGKDMPGRVVQELLDPKSKATKAKKIPSYEKKPQTRIPYRNGWPARKFRPLAEDS